MVQRGMSQNRSIIVEAPTRDDGGEPKDQGPPAQPRQRPPHRRRSGLHWRRPRPSSALCLPRFLGDREILIVSAAGLIPLAIGIGFFVDYGLQRRELARFGLEVAADPPPNNPPH